MLVLILYVVFLGIDFPYLWDCAVCMYVSNLSMTVSCSPIASVPEVHTYMYKFICSATYT